MSACAKALFDDEPEVAVEQAASSGPAWRDPVAFIPLEALIEYGLADVPQDEIKPCQLKNALVVYNMRHPDAVESILHPQPPPRKSHGPAKVKHSPILRLQHRMGALTTNMNLTPEQRRINARLAARIRWGSPQGMAFGSPV